MLVKEIWRKDSISRKPVILRALQGTLLTGVGRRCTVRHTVLDIAIYTYIVLGSKGRPEYQVLPVGLLVAYQLGDLVSGSGPGRIDLGIEVHQFSRRHHRHLLRDMLQTHRTVV